jgi:hypothetical protein
MSLNSVDAHLTAAVKGRGGWQHRRLGGGRAFGGGGFLHGSQQQPSGPPSRTGFVQIVLGTQVLISTPVSSEMPRQLSFSCTTYRMPVGIGVWRVV